MPNAPRQHKPNNHRQPKRIDNRRSASERGYDGAWKRLRESFVRENPLCEVCLNKGFVVAVEIVDHIIPVHVRPDLRLEWDNLQSLCRGCHTRKTNEDLKKYGAAR